MAIEHRRALAKHSALLSKVCCQRRRNGAGRADPGAAVGGDGAEIFFIEHIVDGDAQIKAGKAVGNCVENKVSFRPRGLLGYRRLDRRTRSITRALWIILTLAAPLGGEVSCAKSKPTTSINAVSVMPFSAQNLRQPSAA